MTTISFRDQGTITGINVEKAEQHYNGVFVGDFCLKGKDGKWVDNPVAVFWQETPARPEYSNYFGLFQRDGKLYITNAASAFHEPIDAIRSPESGEVIYSRYGHDFRSLKDGSGCIDGGRDYVRTISGKDGTFPEGVSLQINGPVFDMEIVRPAFRQSNDSALDLEAELKAALEIVPEWEC